jgi:hypothetical protein
LTIRTVAEAEESAIAAIATPTTTALNRMDIPCVPHPAESFLSHIICPMKSPFYINFTRNDRLLFGKIWESRRVGLMPY